MPPPMAPPIRAPGGDANDPDWGKPYHYALRVHSLREQVIAAGDLQGPNPAVEFQQILAGNLRKAHTMFGDQLYQLTWYAEYHTAFDIAQKVGIKYTVEDFGIPMTQGEMAACMARRAAAIASASSSNVAASSGGAASESSSKVAALSGSAASKASPNVAASSDAVAKAAGQASQSFNSYKSKIHGVTSSSQVAPEGTVSDEGHTEGRIPRTSTHIFHGENKPMLPLNVNELPQFSAHCTARNASSGFIGHDQERAMLKAAEDYLQVTLRLAILPKNEGCVVWGDPKDLTEHTRHPEVFASRIAPCQDCLVQWARHRIPGTDDLTMNFDCWFRVWRWDELKREIRGQSSLKPTLKP